MHGKGFSEVEVGPSLLGISPEADFLLGQHGCTIINTLRNEVINF